jgi:hypothetical protein
MDFLAILISIIGGTILFLALHKIFNINHLGFRVMVGLWTVCFIGAMVIFTIILNIIGGALRFSGLL